ncbi:MAG: ADOP family duplicated permease [Bryobacterales bacterium]
MSLLQDIRYGARMLASKPGVTAAAVLSLALGVGANSAVFSLIDAMMLKGLPGVESPQELVILGDGRSRGIAVSDEPVVAMFSYPRYRQLRDGAKTLTALAAIGSLDWTAYLRRGGEESPTAARTRLVSGEYFAMLGVQPARGRLLNGEDDRTTGGHPVAVLDYGYWQERFGADPAAVGSAVVLNERPFTIVGVAPESFGGERLGQRPDIYVPLMMQAEVMRDDVFLDRPDWSFLHLMGRLRPGTSLDQAQTELATLWRSMMEQEGGEQPSEAWTRGMERAAMTLQPGSNGYSGLGRLKDPLWLLLGVTTLVLLIACANVANLLLARGASRTREMGVRVALGADRTRLFTQMLVESLLLAALAGVAAALFALWSREALLSMTSTSARALSLAPGLDWRILSFTALVALATGLLFGVAPAWRAGKTNVSGAMRGGGRGTLGAGGGRLRTALVVGQAALSLLLLFGAGLFVLSLGKLARADVGFARESLLSIAIDPRGAGLEQSKQPEFARRLIAAVEAVPGVSSAVMLQQQIVNYGGYSSSIEIPGYEAAPGEDMDARMFFVTPGYFETVGTPLVAGRTFGPEDAEGSTPAVIVDEVFAERFFAGDDALAKTIQFDGDVGMVPVAGLASTAKLNNVREEARPTVYVSAYAYPQFLNAVTVRVNGDPAAIAGAVRRAIAKTEPRLPINDVTTVEKRLADQAAGDRMLLRLISGFGVLALLLAAVGLYGMLSYRVAGRTSEIGVRMAVGADRLDVLRLVLKEGLLLAGGGVLLGVLVAPFAAMAVRALLFQPEPWNVLALGSAATLLLVVAALAALAPSLRAARLDPVTALREE